MSEVPMGGDCSGAAQVAREDDRVAAHLIGRRFSRGTRPVIRWIKGDGLDDQITRAALGQATRLFGNGVDYCLCTNGIGADRARSILEWASEPVEWWPLTPADNSALAAALMAAGCPPEHFGYWWKWFPERVRPDAPEWILDGDMVITASPSWFAQWADGNDHCRVTQDDRWPMKDLYGTYVDFVDERQRLYSGLISLPPKLRYMQELLAILAAKPLSPGHDGRRDMCEQGVLAATFERLGALPIPLYEFPFGRAFEKMIDYGVRGDQGAAWGYHFGHAFRQRNRHFDRLMAKGVIFSRANARTLVERFLSRAISRTNTERFFWTADTRTLIERFAWLGNSGQWGVPGWALPDGCASIIVERARAFAGRQVLEIGTSRGRLTAMLASTGCRVTTIDRHDRGAAQNLDGLGVRVLVHDAVPFLTTTSEKFDLIVVDLHGNSEADWKPLAPVLERCLSPRGKLIIANATLWKIPEWHEETGVRWLLDTWGPTWKVELHPEPMPGVAIVSHD
jgi:hypothetical protein